MRWDFELSPEAVKQLEKIGPSAAESILGFLENASVALQIQWPSAKPFAASSRVFGATA